jgi:alkylation response protein AidB-like acyl-CoA dehydrogenase
MSKGAKPGGGFLTAPVGGDEVFTREDLSEEQREFANVVKEFYENEVIPRNRAIEEKEMDGDVPLSIRLFRQIGEMGILGVDIAEEYGGLGLDKTTGMAMAEMGAGQNSFACTAGAHAGIGTLPISIYGNHEQKLKWLPKIISGEMLSCYALTEPNSGSDALSGRTTAKLEGDHYILNGEKIYITNGGWADVGIVFARIDGDYSALIVDMHSEGVKRGAEEKKMGIHGSSTTALYFDGVKVPRENLLGKPGDASKVALNILNLGRLKLGFVTIGNAKFSIDRTIKYGKERKQFGQPIISFDIQKRKLADMIAATYAVDAMGYRVMGSIDTEIARIKGDPDYEQKVTGVLKRFALEASIIKITGSENLRDVLDSAIKMHGGYGFMEDYHLEMMARDNVIDQIFEGTNDVNRLTIFQGLAKGIYGAAIDFREYMENVSKQLRRKKFKLPEAEDKLLGEEERCLQAAKMAAGFAIERAIIECGKGISNEQMVMEMVSNMMIAIYAIDSTIARVRKQVKAADNVDFALEAIARVVTRQNLIKVEENARNIICGVVPESVRRYRLEELGLIAEEMQYTADPIHRRRVIADAAIQAGKYIW